MALLPSDVLGFQASELSRQNIFYGWTAVVQDMGAHILVPRYLATKLHGVIYHETFNINSYHPEENKIRRKNLLLLTGIEARLPTHSQSLSYLIVNATFKQRSMT